MNSFNDLAKSLNTLMIKDFLAVNDAKNPLLQIIYRGKFRELVYITQQYSIFPKLIVGWMKLAQQKADEAKWISVAAELQENIAEELGSNSDGISHHDLLVKGLESGLELSINPTFPSSATRNMLRTMNDIFDQSAAYVLGATYAIEATSIPELNLVKQMFEVLLEGDFPQDLQYFFDMHLNAWEPEHEEDLRKSLEAYISPQEFEVFATGFQAALTTMDVWWLQLTAEAMAQGFMLQAA